MAPMPAAARPTLRALVAGLAALTLVLGACSSDDDSGAEVVEQDDATTTEAGGDSTEPDETEPGDTEPAADVTVEDLEGILPSATDIGPDYSEEPEEDETEDEDEENPLAEACPAVAELADTGDDSQKVTRSFATEDERSVEVELHAAPPVTDEAGFDERIDALNDCGSVSFSQDGFDYEVTVAAERSDTFGDLGARLDGTITISGPQLAQPAQLEVRQHIFIVGGLGASIEVFSGLTQTGPDTLAPVPGDFDLLDALGADLEADLTDLQG